MGSVGTRQQPAPIYFWRATDFLKMVSFLAVILWLHDHRHSRHKVENLTREGGQSRSEHPGTPCATLDRAASSTLTSENSL